MEVYGDQTILAKMLGKTTKTIKNRVEAGLIEKKRIHMGQFKGKEKVTLHGNDKGIFVFVVPESIGNYAKARISKVKKDLDLD